MLAVAIYSLFFLINLSNLKLIFICIYTRLLVDSLHKAPLVSIFSWNLCVGDDMVFCRIFDRQLLANRFWFPSPWVSIWLPFWLKWFFLCISWVFSVVSSGCCGSWLSNYLDSHCCATESEMVTLLDCLKVIDIMTQIHIFMYFAQVKCEENCLCILGWGFGNISLLLCCQSLLVQVFC